MARRNQLDLGGAGDLLDDLEPEVVEVGPDGLPGLPAVRPKGGPEYPFER